MVSGCYTALSPILRNRSHVSYLGVLLSVSASFLLSRGQPFVAAAFSPPSSDRFAPTTPTHSARRLQPERNKEQETGTIESIDNVKKLQSRRTLLLRHGVIVPAVMLSTWSGANVHSLASAFDRTYPSELKAPSASSSEYETLDSRARMVRKIQTKQAKRASNVLVATPVLASVVWGSALWFLSGSRSNPIATPLANFIYNSTQETWLQDRNDGLFASLPWEYLIILSVVFLSLGFGANALVSTIAEGDRVISLQLAGVSLIAGASLELGRIASGEKKQTREESNRSVQLADEFARFADERLLVGGNCHRNEVVQAYRRYYGKYRQDSVEYPLTDLEIEQLLRAYCKPRGFAMSSAGFYSGVQINQAADAFVRKT